MYKKQNKCNMDVLIEVEKICIFRVSTSNIKPSPTADLVARMRKQMSQSNMWILGR